MSTVNPRNRYMHTIGGRPAVYIPGEQIIVARHGLELKDLLVPSLKEIQRQRRLTMLYRSKRKWPTPLDYGYLMVRV